MCDYSLANFPNRMATEGELLVVHRFPCGALGLTSVRRSLKQMLFPGTTCAVCVPPGARLLLQDIPETLQRRLGIESREEVTFEQQTAETFTYRDAIRFSNGRQILLQRLECGQRVRVMCLGPAEEAELNHDRAEEKVGDIFAITGRVLNKA